MATSRIRTATILALAGLVPFGTIWGGATLAAKLNKPKPTTATVTQFSDYFTARAPERKTLPAGKEIWSGTTGDKTQWFKDIARVGSTLVVAGRSKLVAIRPNGPAAGAREIALEGIDGGVSTARAAADGTSVWLYTFESGRFNRFSVAGDLEPVERLKLEPALLQPVWLNDRVIANGLFADELWRTYAVAAGPTALDASPERAAATPGGGVPLFPGITPQFGRLLNETVMDVAPSGKKLALAFKWSSRVNIYDARTGALERAIAGPVETKLNFAVDRYEGRPVLTLDPETIYAYVDLEATEHAILALYSGRELRKFRSTMSSGTAIHAFSWDGRPLGEWALTDPVDNITFDAATGTVYGLRWKPHPSVIAIDAAEVTRATSGAGARPRRRD